MFVPFSVCQDFMRGKHVAIIGSAPSVLQNAVGFIDSHDVVVRVNNYKLHSATGRRCDVHYSYYGGAIKKTVQELKNDGVQLCMCKCPNSKPIESTWHERYKKTIGIDFRYIYRMRQSWWFCDTFIPSAEHFVSTFNLLDRHIPSTGFAAILDVLACRPAQIYITGFDFFSSGIHNVNEKWSPGDPTDPIGHKPELEKHWLKVAAETEPIELDEKLKGLLA